MCFRFVAVVIKANEAHKQHHTGAKFGEESPLAGLFPFINRAMHPRLQRGVRKKKGQVGLGDWRIIHRYGRLEAGETIMMVATAARHRAAAFQAAEYLMDWLKSRAPFWKREIGPDGPGDWVAAQTGDEDALARWQG